jgi:hypothetical protein
MIYQPFDLIYIIYELEISMYEIVNSFMPAHKYIMTICVSAIFQFFRKDKLNCYRKSGVFKENHRPSVGHRKTLAGRELTNVSGDRY